MAKQGTVKHIAGNGAFGFIKQDDGGPDVYFRPQWVQNTSVTVGLRVEYETRETSQGLQTRRIRAIGQPQHSPAHSQTGGDYRFLNPYNFVRSLEARPQGHILGNCPPPPHDRYVGLTGRITCEVEAVTPLFISDSHNIKVDPDGEKEHKIYRFFEYDGQPSLPASSLRGMTRSVYEAVTNSCFSVFQEDKPYPFEHREARAPDMKPARVIVLTSAGAILEALDCTENAPGNISGRPTTVRAGAVLKSYPPRVFNPRTKQSFQLHESQLPLGAHDGMRVAALITRKPVTHRSNRFRAFQVRRVVPVAQHATLTETAELRKRFGWLHITGPNIENKHDERLFFRWDDQDPDSPTIETIPQRYLYPCEPAVIDEYNHHLAEYWERLQSQVEGLGNRRWPNSTQEVPHPSTFVEKGRQLRIGDLVYFQHDAQRNVTMLRTVSMPRVRYAYSRQSLLPQVHRKCQSYASFCPACRTFGWVHEEATAAPLDTITAYAGRLHFSHGTLTEDQNLAVLRLPDVPLAILGSPKPTTTQFYLLKERSDGQLCPDGNVDYNDDYARPRGRKFYRHHGKAESEEYTRATDEEHNGRDDQNRTVRGALKPGASFRFNVDFENLTSVELGALLWSLELESGMHHRLGYAKPLGFGSVKVTIKQLQILNIDDRYNASLSTGWKNAFAQKGKLIEDFKDAMKEIYGPRFDDLANVKDLVALSSQPPDLPIHYPRPPHKERGRWVTTPDPEGKNFEWFVGNKKRKETLEIAASEHHGLPMMDRKGRPPES